MTYIICITLYVFRFLERQLLSQRAQWEQEITDLRVKLQQAQDRDTPGHPEINVPVPSELTIYCSLYFVNLSFLLLYVCL